MLSSIFFGVVEYEKLDFSTSPVGLFLASFSSLKLPPFCFSCCGFTENSGFRTGFISAFKPEVDDSSGRSSSFPVDSTVNFSINPSSSLALSFGLHFFLRIQQCTILSEKHWKKHRLESDWVVICYLLTISVKKIFQHRAEVFPPSHASSNIKYV